MQSVNHFRRKQKRGFVEHRWGLGKRLETGAGRRDEGPGKRDIQKNCTKSGLNDPNNHDGVITDLEPDIVKYEVKWALGSITMSKGSGGDGISAEQVQILKDDAVKVLHSICQ